MIETARKIKIKSALMNRALGVFLLLFGAIIVVAMVFTETFVQQMTDLVAGLILISLGGGLVWKARQTLKKHGSGETK